MARPSRLQQNLPIFARFVRRFQPALRKHLGLMLTSRAVVEALERVAHGRRTLLVTHELRHATRCDAIFLVEHGRIAERGTHEELLARGGRYAAINPMQTSPLEGPVRSGAAIALAR
jgi:ABC-type thiamine transport system ATPase subunit